VSYHTNGAHIEITEHIRNFVKSSVSNVSIPPEFNIYIYIYNVHLTAFKAEHCKTKCIQQNLSLIAHSNPPSQEIPASYGNMLTTATHESSTQLMTLFL
jgi:hypothetical protein